MGSVRPGRSIDSALRKKGFLRESDGAHVHYYLLRSVGEKSMIKTKISHGMMGSMISAKLIGEMAHQLHLTKKQFLNLIDCALDERNYREHLRSQGFIV